MSKSKIEWTDRVWNPVTGCTKVSPGCANCYAERMAKRLRGRCGYNEKNPFKLIFHPDRLPQVLKWKPSKIFVCSMGDLFHIEIPRHRIARIFATIANCPQHIFIILTKRPSMAQLFFLEYEKYSNLPNVWLGVSVENQEWADKRIPILLQIPAAVRFISCEPMLGPVDLQLSTANCQLPTLNWVITGGESGPGARPMHPDWARSLRDQCQAAGVPFFFKQWGEWGIHNLDWGAKKHMVIHEGWPTMSKVGKKAAGRLLDGKEWNEVPEVTKI